MRMYAIWRKHSKIILLFYLSWLWWSVFCCHCDFIIDRCHYFFLSGLKKESEQCIRAFLEIPSKCRSLTLVRGGYDELFVDRAGYLFAALTLNKALGRVVVPPEVTLPLFNAIIQSGQEYSRHYHSASPLMYAYYNTEYLGKSFNPWY